MLSSPKARIVSTRITTPATMVGARSGCRPAISVRSASGAEASRENIRWIGHFHTAGNPGRHELDATQELNYRAIAEAIAATGFTGYLGHEYGPVRDPLKGLEEAVRICDV